MANRGAVLGIITALGIPSLGLSPFALTRGEAASPGAFPLVQAQIEMMRPQQMLLPSR